MPGADGLGGQRPRPSWAPKREEAAPGRGPPPPPKALRASRATEEEPQQSEQEDADLEEPLFASHTPANGLTPALQAIAAIIDEDDVRPEPSRPGKRKAESLGEAQVSLALTGLGAGGAQPRRLRLLRVQLRLLLDVHQARCLWSRVVASHWAVARMHFGLFMVLAIIAYFRRRSQMGLGVLA